MEADCVIAIRTWGRGAHCLPGGWAPRAASASPLALDAGDPRAGMSAYEMMLWNARSGCSWC